MATQRRWKNPNELVKMKKKKVERNDPMGHITLQVLQPELAVPSSSLAAKRPLEEQSTAIVKRLKTTDNSEVNDSFGSVSLPTDMSLKSKIRVVSNSSFSWLLSAKVNQEAAGLVAFTKGQSLPEDAVSAFHHSLMYWVHPSITSLSVISPETPPTLDVKFMEVLKDEWIVSFQSVYQLLKAGLCPYFYICGCSFSVLFQQDQALLTPTTSGLREALKKEGVEYTLPFSPVETSPAADSDNEDELSASNWLQSIGLHTSSTHGTTKIASQQQKMQDIDSHPESTVCVSEGHLVALCNFLINCKTLIPTTGQYTGIPPTILSLSAFQGGTLATLKVKQSNQQEIVERQMKQSCYLELSGPVLPQMISNLCGLFQTTQGNFDVYLNTLKASTSFNIPPNYTVQNIKCSEYSFTWK